MRKFVLQCCIIHNTTLEEQITHMIAHKIDAHTTISSKHYKWNLQLKVGLDSMIGQRKKNKNKKSSSSCVCSNDRCFCTIPCILLTTGLNVIGFCYCIVYIVLYDNCCNNKAGNISVFKLLFYFIWIKSSFTFFRGQMAQIGPNIIYRNSRINQDQIKCIYKS